MAAVYKLSSLVERRLRSSVSLASYSRCTEELVYNSLEANSQWIKVKLNLSACAVEVQDDGHGMAMEELATLGTCTSAMTQVTQSQDYAFWGKSLYHIAGVAEQLTVVSRGKLSVSSYQKTFHKGVDLGISPAVGSRMAVGTRVVAEGIFHNLPVRQRVLDYQKETTVLIRFLEHMSVVYPEVFFTLEDVATRKVVLQLQKCHSRIAAICRLANVPLTKSSFACIEVDHACFKIKGCVAKQLTSSKNNQYIFINKRPVMQGNLHGIVNRSVAQRCNQLGRQLQHPQGYAVQFFNVSCDRSEYSLYSDAMHSEAEFKRQHDISTAFQKVGKCIAQHLCRNAKPVHHLADPSATAETASSGRHLLTTKAGALPTQMLHNSMKSGKCASILPSYRRLIPGACENTALPCTSCSTTESAYALQLHSGTRTLQHRHATSSCLSLMTATAQAVCSVDGTMQLATAGDAAPFRSLHQTWAEWKNPVFTTLQERLTSASLPGRDQRTSSHITDTVSMCKFSKEMFQSIEVIGQVDNKFIAGNLTLRNEVGDSFQLLVLVDQHAADERIRLESYLQGVVPSYPNCDNQECPPPSKQLSSPISISDCFSNSCRKPTEHFVQTMHSRGFTLQIKSNNCGVIVKHLPLPLVETVNDRVIPAVAIDQLKDVLAEFMECTEKGQPLPMMPPSLLTILKSLACHGAIRFGDPLTFSQCKELITNLLLCDLPFQCAHGRPSVAPLIRLTAGR